MRYLKRIGLLYLLWSAVYLLYQLPQWYANGEPIRYVLKSLFLSGAHYHLWYLLALLYAVPLLYLLLTFVSRDKLIWVCVAAWPIECLLHAYQWVGVDNIETLTQLISRFDIFFRAAFRAVPLMGMGVLCIGARESKASKWLALTIASFAAFAFEASMLHFFDHGHGVDYSYLLCMPAFTYCAINWLLNIGAASVGQAKLLLCREMSLVIYCVHPLIIGVYMQLGLPLGLPRWTVVTVLSVAIAFVWAQIKNAKSREGRS